MGTSATIRSLQMWKKGKFLFLLLAMPAACLGQTSCLGVTPGRSTRAEVVKILGQPVKLVTKTMAEYGPRQGTGRIFVEYRAEGSVVDRIEVYFLSPAPRATLLERLHLPVKAQTKDADSKGRLVECFGSSKNIALLHASQEGDSGIIRAGCN